MCVCELCAQLLDPLQAFLIGTGAACVAPPVHDALDAVSLRSWLNNPWGSCMADEVYKAANIVNAFSQVRGVCGAVWVRVVLFCFFWGGTTRAGKGRGWVGGSANTVHAFSQCVLSALFDDEFWRVCVVGFCWGSGEVGKHDARLVLPARGERV